MSDEATARPAWPETITALEHLVERDFGERHEDGSAICAGCIAWRAFDILKELGEIADDTQEKRHSFAIKRSDDALTALREARGLLREAAEVIADWCDGRIAAPKSAIKLIARIKAALGEKG